MEDDGKASGDSVANADTDEIKCRLSENHFTHQVADLTVSFYCLRLTDSFVLWIGPQPACMSSLAMAIPTKFDTMPLATNILSDNISGISASLAQKLAKKTGKQVFVSYNLPADFQLLPLIEKRLFEEIKIHSEWF